MGRKETKVKTKLVLFILIGLMLVSVFGGAVSASENSVKSADDNGSVELPVIAPQN